MYDQEKEMDDKSRKFKKFLIISAVVLVSIRLAFLIYNFTWDMLEGDKVVDENTGDELVEDLSELINLSQIPSFEGLDEAMMTATSDIHKKSLEEIFKDLRSGNKYYQIPNTSILIDTTYVGSHTDLMSLTLVSLSRNPYAIKEEHPSIYKLALGYTEDTSRTLPDGTQIDLGALEEKYTDIRFSHKSNDPTKIRVTGKVNTEYFSSEIDLMPYYSFYANNR